MMVVFFPYQLLHGRWYSDEVLMGVLVTLLGIGLSFWQFSAKGAINSQYRTMIPNSSQKLMLKNLGWALILSFFLFLVFRNDCALQFIYSYAITTFLSVLIRTRDVLPLSFLIVFLVPLAIGRLHRGSLSYEDMHYHDLEIVMAGGMIDLRFVIALISAVLIYTAGSLSFSPLQNRQMLYRLAVYKLFFGAIFSVLLTLFLDFRNTHRPLPVERDEVVILQGNPVSILARKLDDSFLWTRPRYLSSAPVWFYESAVVEWDKLPCFDRPDLHNRVQWTAEYITQKELAVRWHKCDGEKNHLLDRQILNISDLKWHHQPDGVPFFNSHTGELHWYNRILLPSNPVQTSDDFLASYPNRLTGYQNGDVLVRTEYKDGSFLKSTIEYKGLNIPYHRVVQDGLSSLLGAVWDQILILVKIHESEDYKLFLVDPETLTRQELSLDSGTLQIDFSRIVGDEIWVPVKDTGCAVRESIPVYLRLISKTEQVLVHMNIKRENESFSWVSLSHKPDLKIYLRNLPGNEVCGVRHTWIKHGFDTPSFGILKEEVKRSWEISEVVHINQDYSFMLSNWNGELSGLWPYSGESQVIYTVPVSDFDSVHKDLKTVKSAAVKLNWERRTDETHPH
ncbi:MAG: hypothetical protein H3C47_10230 [Candidatus Cloacimonetes bacterium]|nr:hypothetical protein [Candidatus Cloacimonadota bacterium]